MTPAIRIACCLMGIALASPTQAAQSTVALGSLLDEMADRDRAARLADPPFHLIQASSCDRASTTSADTATWFANYDWSQFIREEPTNGRREWVMMEDEGPGAIVRIWVTGGGGGTLFDGTLRIYLDGETTPALAAPVEEFVGGSYLAEEPFSAVTGRGRSLYLPIPYAHSCKVTYDGSYFWDNPDFTGYTTAFWYHVNYRRYAAGTPVRSLDGAQLAAESGRIAATGAALSDPPPPLPDETDVTTRTLAPGESLIRVYEGPAAIRSISLQLAEGTPVATLMKTFLKLRFDGEDTAEAPIGPLFGGGAGFNPANTWWRSMRADRSMSCRWTMPFQSHAELHIENRGATPVSLRLEAGLGSWEWDSRSLHFHANWRDGNPLAVPPAAGFPKPTWEFLSATGPGHLLADTLTLENASRDWWGEGDEKIWIDGEGFPSHFGTGTEDYYGYAWASTAEFSSPFHAQPVADSFNGNLGNAVNSRDRVLDLLPFNDSIRFEMEVWHKNRTGVPLDIRYSTMTAWHQLPASPSRAGAYALYR